MLLGRDPHWAQGALHCAQGSIIQRSSLGAELACGAAHKTSRGAGILIEDLRSAQSSTIIVTVILYMASLREILALRRPHLGQRSPLL